jgi:hypothetical protein
MIPHLTSIIHLVQVLVNNFFEKRKKGPKAPLPSFSGSSVHDSAVQSLAREIVNLISAINGVYSAAAESAALLEQASATVSGSINYLNLTADDMADAENEAKSMMDSWASRSGGVMR